MGRNLQREYEQEPQVAVITPLLEGTDGVQKMSKSLGNYIGIDEPPFELVEGKATGMFGKVMSISDNLMWRYYELCTDLTQPEIAVLRESAESGERNPRDIKVELAKIIVTDFHSAAEAKRAEEEFNRYFRLREPSFDPWSVKYGRYKLVDLLIATNLVVSKREARRLIEQGGVSVNKERCAKPDYEIDLSDDQKILLQIGKRLFLEVSGAN
jgi:tyrosyl-tRNA synthetase